MIECNRGCGQDNLHWKVINEKYKLFGQDGLLHMCNDGVLAHSKQRKTATARILNELGIKNVNEIPSPDVPEKSPTDIIKERAKDLQNIPVDINKCFTINSTASGISLTGEDKHNAIYLPKIAVPELVKALVDFI